MLFRSTGVPEDVSIQNLPLVPSKRVTLKEVGIDPCEPCPKYGPEKTGIDIRCAIPEIPELAGHLRPEIFPEYFLEHKQVESLVLCKRPVFFIIAGKSQ